MIRKYFAIASVLLFLAVIAVAIDDYNQEWRRWQRAYYTELALQKKGSLSLWDRLQIERQLSLNVTKVVTEPGRSADACMACHVNQGGIRSEQNPLKDLGEIHNRVFVLKDMPFDQVGCTACHGGDPLALTTERAHERMQSRYREIFLESLARLRSAQQMVRQRAIEMIRWMTGSDFGFVFDDPVERREAAIQSIEAWWELHKDVFLVEGLGERESPFLFVNPQAQAISQLTTVSPIGEPLEFLGSNTCLGCHANPNPGGSAYIPPSNREHALQWFQDAFKTSKQPELYLINHPFLAEVLSAQTIQDPKQRDELLELIKSARRTGKAPEPKQIEAMVEVMRTMDLTCEACHGPGSEYVPLMMKGLALEFQGRTTEAAEMISKAKEIALDNARESVSEPQFWRMLETLIARLQSTQTPSEQLER